MLTWSPSGVNLLCRGIISTLDVVACPRAYGIVGGASVPKLRRETSDGAPVSPNGSIAAASVGIVPLI